MENTIVLVRQAERDTGAHFRKQGGCGNMQNLNRNGMRSLLITGVIGSVVTGCGDFLLGYGDQVVAEGFRASLMANAVNVPDWQLIVGGLLGVFGIFLEAVGFFAVYRSMLIAAPRFARAFKVGIFGYVWLAPIGCHMNVGLMNLAYKRVVQYDSADAGLLADQMIFSFGIPIYALLALFWLLMIVTQWIAISKGLTLFPGYTRWFNVVMGSIVGAIAFAVTGVACGFDSALASGIGTMFLSVGNLFMFLGLLISLPKDLKLAKPFHG